MSKRVFGTLTLLMFVVGLVAVGAPVAKAADFKLTYSNLFPPAHVQSKLAQSWCDEVNKRTGGRVEVQYFPGQTLTKAKQVYDGVVSGLSDVGLCLLGYTRGRFPLMEAPDLPLGYKSGVVATQIVNEFLAKFKPKELSDTEVMYLHAHGPGNLNTRTKPVKNLAELKGLKIRSHGTTAPLVKGLGATPVAMPMPTLYQALQKGVVDGALYPFEAQKGWRLADVTKFTTKLGPAAYTSTFFVVMNKDKWNAFPADIKKIINKWKESAGQCQPRHTARGPDNL